MTASIGFPSPSTSTDSLNPELAHDAPFSEAAHPALPLALSAEERLVWQARLNQMPAFRHFGATVDLSSERLVRIDLPRFEPHHLGGLGGQVLNGGIVAGLVDAAVGVTGLVHLPQSFGKAGTVELSIKLLRPVRGSSARLVARAVKKTERLVFAEVHVLDERTVVCGTASGLFCSA